MRNRVVAVMAAVFERPEPEISDDMTLGMTDCWDSLRHMTLVLALEDEFQVAFSVEEIVDEMNTLPLILKTLDRKRVNA
jgi:acyl carrier protein